MPIDWGYRGYGNHYRPSIGQWDLNTALIDDHDGEYESLIDPGARSEDGLVEVYFRGIEKRLVELIEQAPVVVGCVAWLTSEPILRVLAEREAVCIVVQKEDFLRPDFGSGSDWTSKLRGMYDNLPGELSRYVHFEGTRLHLMSYGTYPDMEPVRCVGNFNRSRKAAFPRSHHKFVVFCGIQEKADIEGAAYPVLEPYAVWTGSFNFTRNAGMSLENAVLLRDGSIVNAFYQEFGQVAALSEPLNWEHEWCVPELRIGS